MIQFQWVRLWFLMFSVLVFSPSFGQETQQRLRDHVQILASDSLQGRGLGTQGAEWAREYIKGQFADAGIKAFKKDYLQSFSFRQSLAWVQAYNVVGFVEGTHPALKDEYIVIGAHYDHLGYELKGEDKNIFPGADDNASGVASIIEIGRYFAANPHLLGRSLIVVAFDAEESGLLGSRHFVDHSPVALQSIRKMFSLDMVGMYATNNGVNLRGIGTLSGGEDIARSIADQKQVRLRNVSDKVEQRTDTAPFGSVGISATHVFTGMKSPYHKPGDQYHLLDYEGMARVVAYMSALIAHLSFQEILQPASSLVASASHTQENVISKFSTGFLLNTGSGFHRYPDEFFRANAKFNISTGLYLQVPVTKIVALQAEALYDLNRSRISGGNFQRHSLTFPVNIQVGTPGVQGAEVRLFCFAGGYYRYSFAGNIAGELLDFDQLFHREEWGYSLGIGLQVFRFYMGYTSRRALSSLSRIDSMKILDTNGYFSLGYRF